MPKTRIGRAAMITIIVYAVLALLNLNIAPNKKEAVIIPTPTPSEQPTFDQLYPATAESENGLVYDTKHYCRGLYSHVHVSYVTPNAFVIVAITDSEDTPSEGSRFTLGNFPTAVQQLYLSTGIRVRFQVKVESGIVYFRFLGLLAPPGFLPEDRYQKSARRNSPGSQPRSGAFLPGQKTCYRLANL